MKFYNKTSTALKLVENMGSSHRYQADCTTVYADIRKDLRSEAKMLAVSARFLLILGVAVSAILCMVNGFICHELMNTAYISIAGIEPKMVIGVFIAMAVAGLLFAGMSIFLSLVLSGVAETLREEAKKIR